MSPKMAKKIRVIETQLRDAIFMKDREKVADCMDALNRHGFSREEMVMESARNFLRQCHINQN